MQTVPITAGRWQTALRIRDTTSSDQQRMAIQIEEIIFDSDSIKLEDFFYNRKHLLGLCVRGSWAALSNPGTGLDCLPRTMRFYIEVIHDPVRRRILRARSGQHKGQRDQ